MYRFDSGLPATPAGNAPPQLAGQTINYVPTYNDIQKHIGRQERPQDFIAFPRGDGGWDYRPRSGPGSIQEYGDGGPIMGYKPNGEPIFGVYSRAPSNPYPGTIPFGNDSLPPSPPQQAAPSRLTIARDPAYEDRLREATYAAGMPYSQHGGDPARKAMYDNAVNEARKKFLAENPYQEWRRQQPRSPGPAMPSLPEPAILIDGRSQRGPAPDQQQNPFAGMQPGVYSPTGQFYDGNLAQGLSQAQRQRDAFVMQMNQATLPYQMANVFGSDLGAPSYDFQGMLGRANKMVEDGFYNPFTQYYNQDLADQMSRYAPPSMYQSDRGPRGGIYT